MEASEGVTQTTPAEQTPATEPAPEPPPAPSTEQAPAPAEPQEQVPPPPAGEPQEPAPPPNIGDALQQMNQNLTELRERVVGQEPAEDDYLSSLFGDPEPEPEGTTYQPAPQQQPQHGQQPEQQPSQDQQAERQLEAYIQNRIESALEPHLAAQQLQQDRRDVLALAEKHPRMKDPAVAKAVGARLDELAQRYDNEAMRTDPFLAEQQYLAWEAQQAGQPTSPGAEVPGQAPAAAGGNQGVAPMETGAGPGVPPAEVDPQTQAYIDALAGGGPQQNRDLIG